MKVKMIKLAIMVCIIILVVSSYILIKDFLENKESKNSSIELIKTVEIQEEKEKTKVDWNKLETINKDIIGWIKIENTNINYPILKDTDSLRYLNHSFDGKYNKNGSIFTLNENPFENNETIIYGHNMKSGLMFSELEKYRNEEFLNIQPNFEIYTKNVEYKATIFSCYSIDINEEEKNIKLLNFQEEIEYYKKASTYCINNIGEIEKIVKLSTCSYLNNHTTPTEQRYYIIAKLEKANDKR